MAIRNIRLRYDEALRKQAREVKEINDKVLELIDDMAETMYSNDGVGLAAPQVGILKRIVVIDIGEGLLELINPVIVETKGEQINSEACLSVPGLSGKVVRPTYVKVEALNRNSEKITVEGKELLAIALCHEIDHLDGILYIDKAIGELDRVTAESDLDDEF